MATQIPPAIAKIAPDGNLTARQKRHFMINMLKRRVRHGTGSSHEFIRGRTAMNPWPDLRPILQGISWVIVGDVATRAYMPERMTKDMDILIHQNDKETVLSRLKQAGYQILEPLAIPGFALTAPDGTEVDLLLGNEAWLKEALNEPIQDAAGYPIIRLPYLILLKMGAQRAQDWADVSLMLGLAPDAELNDVRAVVARYTPEDVEDLESLIFIGKQENEPPAV